MSFALPKELNFHDTIPVDRGSHHESQVITPMTGNVSYLGANQDTIIFKIYLEEVMILFLIQKVVI